MDNESWNSRYQGRELVWTATPNQFLVAEVDSLVPGRALDLGCGEGRNAVWLAEQGWAVTAVDFSDVGISKGREMAEKRGVEVTWVVEDLNRYQPAEQSFDLVIIFYIHIPPDQQRALLLKASEAVAAGGTLLVVGHDLTNLQDGYGGPQDPDLLITPEFVVAALVDLEVVTSTRVRRTVQNEMGSFQAIDTLVRAGREPEPEITTGTVGG